MSYGEVPKAIDTWYARRCFRSRLEARWAIAFDALGIPWEYESCGYDLGDGHGKYLPDFLLRMQVFDPGPLWRVHVEVKPETADDVEWLRARRFGHMINKEDHLMLLLRGEPGARVYPCMWWVKHDFDGGKGFSTDGHVCFTLLKNNTCALWAPRDGDPATWCRWPDDRAVHRSVTEAFDIACERRFEHISREERNYRQESVISGGWQRYGRPV